MSWWVPTTASRAAGPTNTSLPTISGIPEVGQKLTEGHGTWTPAQTSFAYQWWRCDSSGSRCPKKVGTGVQTYTLVAADAGHTIRVDETAGSTTASSAATGIVLIPTKTEVLATPDQPLTNVTVTLIATVTSGVRAKGPSGAITFKNGETAISGCANLPVTSTAQTVTVTCQTSFPASAVQLTAEFAPGAGSNMSASASGTDAFMVGRDATSTALDVSTTADVGQSTTYTATVAPPPARPGPIEPTGSVEFFDGGQPIASCVSQPLVNGGATCAVTYGAPGTHSITAAYGGDTNFTGSAATAQPVNVVQLSAVPQPGGGPPVPQAPAGQTPAGRTPASMFPSITATIQWMFYYTPAYTTVRALVVYGAFGATMRVDCHGRGCPFGRRITFPAGGTGCGTRGARLCPGNGRIDLTSGFHAHRLSIGAQITVAITRPGWVGKYYSFTVRARRTPRITITCLAPGVTHPRVRPSGPTCRRP